MAERAINQKKSQFLSSFAPVSASLDDLIREKLECGKFPLTKTGWVKIVAMLVCLAALALFLGQDWQKCSNKPDWYYDEIFPACVGVNFGVELCFYLIFSFGGSVKYPGKWVTADIILNLIFSIAGIIGSVIVTASAMRCTENSSFHKIPGPVGIAGGVLSIIGCGAIFLMYRYVDEEDETPVPQSPMERNIDPRKSMHA